MITAVDTSVLLDVWLDDARFFEASSSALKSCRAEGPVTACELVWAETAAYFASDARTQAALADLGVQFDSIKPETALRAGASWRAYRSEGGPRARVLPDFLIGAHALLQADRLLTRDRGFYRRYFSKLEVLDPSKHRR